MPFSYDITTASGSDDEVSVPFPYIAEAHIHVSADDVEYDQATLTFLDPSNIQLPETPEAGVSLKVWRSTSITTPLVNFQPGTFSSTQMNLQTLQLLYVAQEVVDDSALALAAFDELAGLSDELDDAIAAAAASAAAALTSETAAAASETAAAASEAAAAAVLAGAVQAADLASTDTGKGASTVGVEDAAAKFTATDLEAVLLEIATALEARITAALLASTSNGEGAALVGSEDAGGYFTGTTVEAQLQEVGADASESTGSWTPVLEFDGATTGITYSVQSGEYIKAGNRVVVWGEIVLTSKGSATGVATISGLPFTHTGSISNALFTATNLSTTDGDLQASILPSDTELDLNIFAAGALASLDEGDFDNNTVLRFTAVYKS